MIEIDLGNLDPASNVAPDEFSKLPIPQRFMLFAEAHRQSALDVCKRALEHLGERTWPNCAVVRFHQAHSIECVLKAGLWFAFGKPSWDRKDGHDLEVLLAQFEEHFALVAERIRGLGYMRLSLKHRYATPSGDRLSDASIAHRYPVGGSGGEWQTMEPFEPECTFEELFELGEVMGELEELMAKATTTESPHAP